MSETDWEPAPIEAAETLHQVAHARSGDKGDISNIVVIPYRDEDYDALVEMVTADRVKAHFGELATGDVERYPVENHSLINFVIHGALDGGASVSLRLDELGKSLSYHMLRFPLDEYR
jgi:hypothetical protein